MDLHIFDSLNNPIEVHNTLRRLICIDCLPMFPVENQRSMRIFKENSRNYLTIAEQGLDDPIKIFDALEAKGKVKAGDYETLKKLVSDADYRILPLIETAEKRLIQIQDVTNACESKRQRLLDVVSPGSSSYDVVYNERRILLIGKTGVGKSETGNRILGRREFETDTSDESITAFTSLGITERFGKRLMVVDTPGLFDTKRTNEETISEIMKCYAITTPGLHAILLVHDIGGGRMTDEQINTINIFQERFGKENLDKFLMVVFTGTEKLKTSGKTIDSYVTGLKPDSNLKKLLQSIDNRYVALSLTGSQDDLDNEINGLMAMIERVFETNGGQCYTNSMYKQAETVFQARIDDMLRVERERHEQEVEERLKPVREEHERKEKDLQKQLEEKDRELEEKDDDIIVKAKKEWDRFKRRGFKF